MKRYSRVFIFAYCLIILFSSIFCRKEESSLFSLTVSFNGCQIHWPLCRSNQSCVWACVY